MTWSIIARDDAGRFGSAIASRFLAVGALCAYTRRGVGAVATQALANPLYGPAALDRLAAGEAPEAIVEALTQADAGRGQRQLHLIGAQGAGAVHTGGECIGWAGHHLGDGFSVAGNMLAGEAVVESSAAAFREAAGKPLAERLLAALAAGDAAGGDKRGKQAGALRIQGDEEYAELDLRVDDHAEPVVELQRLYILSFQRLQPFLACLPGRHDPDGVIDRQEIEARIARFHAEHGITPEPAA